MNPGEFDFAADARADRRLASLIAGSPDCVTVARSSQRLVARADRCGRPPKRQATAATRTSAPSDPAWPPPCLLGDREELAERRHSAVLSHGHGPFAGRVGAECGDSGGRFVCGAADRVGCRGAWRWRSIVAIVAAYTLVTGAEPPVLRAAVLVVLMCLAAWTGRRGVGVQLACRRDDRGSGDQSVRAVSNGNSTELSLRGGADVGRHSGRAFRGEFQDGSAGSPDRRIASLVCEGVVRSFALDGAARADLGRGLALYAAAGARIAFISSRRSRC